jgi:hypothetical protein
MAKAAGRKEVGPSLFKNLWQMGALVLSGATPLVHQLREGFDGKLDHYARLLEKRLVVLAVRGFAMFLSLFSIGLGFLFIVIDYGGVPRGIACLGAGFFGLIVLVIWMQLTKESVRPA